MAGAGEVIPGFTCSLIITIFLTVQVHSGMSWMCPQLSSPALTAHSVHGWNWDSKDAFQEVHNLRRI